MAIASFVWQNLANRTKINMRDIVRQTNTVGYVKNVLMILVKCFFISDDYGRAMYLGIGEYTDDYQYVVMLFQPDGSYDERGLMNLNDKQNYQSALREFKELNDWNVKPAEN